ncbi:MAG: 3-oxoacyl-ACP reductase FabG [Gammaproteobacteria bacterium]|nr:3-oxoacyl-ACP reductase FabG [Gammaproteobacteria bacterium]
MGILDNEIALVTGATRGIGKAVALVLGREGATVVGTATSESGSENITNYLKDNGIKGYGTVLDVTDGDAIDAVLKTMTESLGGSPGILVNNAGITRDNLLMRMKEDEWDAIMETNLKPIYRLSKAVLRPMTKARKGRIISISSVVGAMGNAGQTNYGAAKAGVVGFTKSLAREVAGRNITVNAVAPGFIDTDMTRSLSDEQKSAVIAQVPLGRLGTPEDIAEAVLFLASDRGGYITGTTIHVNGGMYMN